MENELCQEKYNIIYNTLELQNRQKKQTIFAYIDNLTLSILCIPLRTIRSRSSSNLV